MVQDAVLAARPEERRAPEPPGGELLPQGPAGVLGGVAGPAGGAWVGS